MTIKKVRAGEYIYGDYAIIREDVPSMGEFDEAPTDVTWFVVPAQEIDTTGLPDAMHEAGTLRACRQWLDKRKGSN